MEQENLVSTATPIKLPHPSSSIEAIRERVLQSENGFVEFSREEDSLWVEAFVTSSDEGGNFFKEIYVQDKPIASNTALKILMDRTALSDYFPRGSQLIILLNGLGAGFNNNVLTLGSYQGNNIGHISEYLLKNHVKKSDSLYSITENQLT